MSKDHCDYHPAKPAVWHCGHCRKFLCPECVPGSRANYEGAQPRCVLCNTELTWLGGANMAEPFWTQAGRFFGYPLKPAGLAVLGCIVVASALLPANLLGILGLVLLFALIVHYGLLIIERVRNGDLDPPGLSEVFRRDGENLFLKQIAVIFLLGAFVVAATQLSPAVGILVLVFVMLAMPASTMLLAMTSSVMDAVHPGNLALLMWRIGPTYLLLWLCLMVVTAGPTVVMPLLVDILPQQALFPAFMSVSAYFTFVTYAMMGYILYEKQARLGFASDDEFGEDLEYRQFVVRRALADARILAAHNRHEQALDVLRGGVAQDESNLELRELYYRIVMASGDEEAIRRNTNSICEFLVARNLAVKAMQYCMETRKNYADFMPNDSTVCHKVAEQCFERRRYKEAVGLLLKLHKTAPQYPEMIDAHILMARVFFEGLDAKDKAIALLQQIRTRHPDHAEISRVDRLLEVMTYSGPANA